MHKVQSKKESNRLQVKTSIDVVRWLTLQRCAFRRHDETSFSRNRGNFLELVSLLASYNDKVARVVMENAPKNAKYTSHIIQKEILHILANKVPIKFVMMWEILNFVSLLMKHVMNPKENKWPLF